METSREIKFRGWNIVVWGRGGFVFRSITHRHTYYPYNADEKTFTVIGNVYENPELNK